MLHAVALLALVAAQQERADAALAVAPDPGPVTCSGPVADPASAANRRSAVAGGTWWLRNSDDPAGLAGSLTVVDANGNEIVAAGVRRTNIGTSLTVPAGAAAADVFELHEDGADTGIALAVVDASDVASVTLVDAVLAGTQEAPCPEAFCSNAGDVPRVQLVDVTYSGGPVIVDVAATDPEVELVDTTSRNVDSFVLAAVTAPSTVRMQAGPARSQSMPIDVHVRLTSVDDRSIVGERLLPLAETDDPPTGTPPPPCPQGGPFPRGGCTTGFFGCGAQCPPSVALLAIPLGGRRLLRRLSRLRSLST